MTDIEQVSPEMLEFFLAVREDHPEDSEIKYTSPLVELLVSADRDQLSQSFTEHNYTRGEVIFHEGDEGDTMFLVWAGQVVIVKGSLQSPTILAYRGAGEIFGEMALLEHQPRSASIIALEDTRLLGLSRLNFEQFLRTNPSVSRSIMEVLSARLRRMSEARSSGELSEKRLTQQVSTLQSEKQRLEEVQRLREETTELIIHDLRNPLSAIGISLRMLSLVLPEDILQANSDLFGIAQASTQRLQRLVDSLLEVSRMESGETRFSMSEFELPPLVDELIQRTSILARKGVVVTTNIATDLPAIVADREKIERVMVNMLDNALKYTPENGRISIEMQRKDGSLWVSVADTGPGIPFEDRERIFERFTQGVNLEMKRRGFGLGLAYCRLAVERHGGKIWVEDGEEGMTTRFVFTLPLLPQSDC
ncbi:MAG: ATP-binding protein [Anaerolineales bacterium]|nr:ATP-binding protein [Anaerolineales bacterium]